MQSWLVGIVVCGLIAFWPLILSHSESQGAKPRRPYDPAYDDEYGSWGEPDASIWLVITVPLAVVLAALWTFWCAWRLCC